VTSACFECSLAAAAPVLAGKAEPGHLYACPKQTADPNDAEAVAAAAAACSCCCDDTHHVVQVVSQ